MQDRQEPGSISRGARSSSGAKTNPLQKPDEQDQKANQEMGGLRIDREMPSVSDLVVGEARQVSVAQHPPFY